MSLQGAYDLNLYDPDVPSTWPQPTTDPLYQPGMFWQLSADAVWPPTGEQLHRLDYLYAYGTPRTYGAGLFGEAPFGGPDNVDWIPGQVAFTPRVFAIDPADRDALPGAGCELLAGWRIVVDWLGNWDPAARLFGTLEYGAGYFGDQSGSGADTWNDVTEHVTLAGCVAGNLGAESWRTEVAGLQLQIVDDTGTVIGIPASATQPTVGTRWRVGVLDPQQSYHWLWVGRCETVSDVHDAPPRVVTVEAFGHVMDLVHTVQPNRPPETADERLREVLTGWTWSSVFTMPAVPGPDLLTLNPDSAEQLRTVMDGQALSAGWTLDTDNRGRLRAQVWPLPAGAPVADVSDCRDDPAGALVAESITYAADMAALVNTVELVNTADSTGAAEDTVSVALYGIRDSAAGLPAPKLHTPIAGLQPLAHRIVDRYADNVERVRTVFADAGRDPRWLPILADLTRGDTITVHRTEAQQPYSATLVVTGVEHFVQPGSWLSTIHLTPT